MAKRKTAAERKLEQEAARLKNWEEGLDRRETQAEDERKRRREREVVEARAADEKQKELDKREAEVAQRERDAEAGKALRAVGRALVEGAFLGGDPDGRQYPSPLMHMLFGHPGRGYY